jgi:glucose-1-phosphate adenylyltransferase
MCVDLHFQVPIGGSYRLIDVPMSNCINSGINKVYILTQFNSMSLNRHLSRAYDFSNGVAFGNGFVEVRNVHSKGMTTRPQ